MNNDKIYVGDLNFLDKVSAKEQFAKDIELVEVTLREEVVFDVDLSPRERAELAKELDDFGIPVIQMHAQAVRDVVAACRDAGVKARLEVICRPYHSYGYDSWRDEIRSVVEAGADTVRLSITTPRKWTMGDPSMSIAGITERAEEAVKYALDIGAPMVAIGFTDVPRTDLDFLFSTAATAVSHGAKEISLCDTVGVGKPALWRYLVHRMKGAVDAKVRVHCHNDFGLATANTLASLEAGADQAEVVVNGADPARSGIAAVAEVVMALKCLYGRDLGYRTEMLTGLSRLFADRTGIPIADQMPVVADRNWMYKRDHILRTIVKDESIQFPYSPSLVGQEFQIGLGRGSGVVGVTAKLAELALDLPDTDVPALVNKVTSSAIERKRRLTDDEFVALVKSL